MEAVRADLIADCGGLEAVSTARRLLIDLAAAAAVRCQRVNAFLASLNSLVDKRHRREWQVATPAGRRRTSRACSATSAWSAG